MVNGEIADDESHRDEPQNSSRSPAEAEENNLQTQCTGCGRRGGDFGAGIGGDSK